MTILPSPDLPLDLTGKDPFARRIIMSMLQVFDASGAIPETSHSFVRRAIGTAEDCVVLFDAVADHLASAVRAYRGQSVNGALKGIKCVLTSVHYDGKCLVVIVSTYFAFRHSHLLRGFV